MAGDLDEVSQSIGRLEGSVQALVRSQEELGENVTKGQDDIWTELKDARKEVTKLSVALMSHKIKVAGLSGSVAILMMFLYEWVKSHFFNGG